MSPFANLTINQIRGRNQPSQIARAIAVKFLCGWHEYSGFVFIKLLIGDPGYADGRPILKLAVLFQKTGTIHKPPGETVRCHKTIDFPDGQVAYYNWDSSLTSPSGFPAITPITVPSGLIMIS